jgi:hypothetical protein
MWTVKKPAATPTAAFQATRYARSGLIRLSASGASASFHEESGASSGVRVPRARDGSSCIASSTVVAMPANEDAIAKTVSAPSVACAGDDPSR